MAVAILFAPAAASAKTSKTVRTTCTATSLKAKYSANYYAVAKSHGKRAPGRNIRKWGITTTKPSNCKQIAKSLRTLRSMRHPGNYLLVASKPTIPPAGTSTLRASSGGWLAKVRQCESGGNYSANTGNGFYGAYQFTLESWRAVGGSGNPANASPAEQDKRASMLRAQSGAGNWPNCG